MKPRELSPPALAHFGWSHDELNVLRDMLADGFTAASIGLCLNRSKKAVTDMAQRSGIPVKRRGQTHQVQIHVRDSEHVVLVRYADERGLTVGTFCRIVLELAAKSPAWIDRLLDDDRHINADAAEPPMVRAPTITTNVFKPVAPVATVQPQLTGSVGEFTITLGP